MYRCTLLPYIFLRHGIIEQQQMSKRPLFQQSCWAVSYLWYICIL